ncbi:MAG: hypothetical protein ABI858_07550, partial [Pseudoxanthomonas sp.]
MTSNLLISVAACVLVAATAIPTSTALAAQSVPSERSQAAPVLLMPKWRSETFPRASVTRLEYPEIAVSRLLKVQQSNASRRFKAPQIGIARVAGAETIARNLPALKWV